MATQQFFYDNNIRSWITQIIRVFSNFTVEYGLDANGNQMYSRVPVIWGDSSFNAATILRLNSENVMPSAPLISIYVSNLKYTRERIQDPTFVDSRTVRTREYDEETGKYLNKQTNAYTVKKLMPVPYNLVFKVDIVTSSTNQKCQLLEQILPLFNPAMEIQKNDNYYDWESLSIIEIKDVNYSNRTIPVGQGSDSLYDIATLEFEAPIWMSLPAKVSKMGVIFKTVMNIYQNDPQLSNMILGTPQVVTFNNYGVYLQNGNLRILNQNVQSPNSSLYGTPLDWSGILMAYGNIIPTISKIGLTFDNSNDEILGTISINANDSSILTYTIDPSTMPSNTISNISGIINPPSPITPTIGDSYLLTGDIGPYWPYENSNIPVVNGYANTNDIIHYDGNVWSTIFSSENNVGNINYVWDSNGNVQYQWNGNIWIRGWNGPYDSSSWRLIL